MERTLQRQSFARRILWLVIGPDACKYFKFPWCEKASKILTRAELAAAGPEPPAPPPAPPIPSEPPPPTPPEPAPPAPPTPPPPYVPPPIYIPPWEPGPPHIPSPPPTGLKYYTVYSDADDGYIWWGTSVWSNVRNATSGTWPVDTGGASTLSMSAVRFGGNQNRIFRSFFRFDLSALPSKTVKYACLQITCYSLHASDVAVQEGTQHSPLVKADYSAFTGLGFAAKNWTGGDNHLYLNAAGITYIQSCLGSSAKLCCREYSHDYMDVEPTGVIYYRNGCCFREWGTQAQRPQLIIGM